MIKVKLFPILAQRSNSGKTELEIEYQPGMVAADILEREGFAVDDASPILVIVNDEQVDPDQPLRDGDRVELMMAVEGG